MILLKNCFLDEKIEDILICDKKIIKIGKINVTSLKKIFNKELQIYDINKNYTVAGIIDNHVHVLGGGGETGFDSRIKELTIKDIVMSGVTTVVGVLGTDSITKSVENLISKTKELNCNGITAYCLTGSFEYPSPTITGKLEKDLAFINEVIGVKIAISDHRCYNPTVDNLITILSKARIASLISGKLCTVNFHIGYGKENMEQLLKIVESTNIPSFLIRPTHISNSNIVFEQAITLAKKGCFIDLTANSQHKKIADYIYKVYTEGLLNKLTLSSDAGGSIPIWKNNKCEGFKKHGMEDILLIIKELVENFKIQYSKAFTIVNKNVGEALGIKYKGKIEEGYDADIIILDHEFKLKMLIANGKVFVENYGYTGEENE